LSALPAPPTDDSGQLAINRYGVLGALYDGVLAPCGACGQTTGWWWRQGGDDNGVGASYYPVHQRCVDRMIETWREMIADGGGAGLSGAPLAGAYARRAAARGKTGMMVATLRSINSGSPYFRPGMSAGTPWTAVARSALGGVVIAPCGGHEWRAIEITRRWQVLSRHSRTSPGEAPMIGGCVVGPDGAVSCGWGEVPGPGSTSPWEPIERASWAGNCPECGARRWPGCWRGTVSGWCMECLRRSSPRPWWPVDADERVVVVARKPKKRAATLD
jgi:hypothetical protein